DVAFLAGVGDGAVHVLLDALVEVEVGLDILLRLLLWDAELVGEAEGAEAVNDAEVDGLGAAAFLSADHHRRDAEDFGGGARVDVFAFLEGLLERFVARDVREDAEFNLRIVRAEELHTGRRDESGADAASKLSSYRDVL